MNWFESNNTFYLIGAFLWYFILQTQCQKYSTQSQTYQHMSHLPWQILPDILLWTENILYIHSNNSKHFLSIDETDNVKRLHEERGDIERQRLSHREWQGVRERKESDRLKIVRNRETERRIERDTKRHREGERDRQSEHPCKYLILCLSLSFSLPLSLSLSLSLSIHHMFYSNICLNYTIQFDV